MSTTLSGTLILSRAVLSEVPSDPNVLPLYVVAGTAGSVGTGGSAKTDDLAQDGAFRNYGNGNTRLILGTSLTRTQTFALRALSPAQVEIVKSLIGHTVCYRDTYGRRVFGAFLDISITDIPLSGRFEDGSLQTDIGIIIQSVTYPESV